MRKIDFVLCCAVLVVIFSLVAKGMHIISGGAEPACIKTLEK